MRQSLRVAIACVLTLGLTTAAFAQATVKPAVQKPAATSPKTAPKAAAPKTTLPAAIDAAFKKAYPNATVKNVSKEKGKDGKDEYEVESLDRGLARDLVYRPDGTVIEFEEQVAAADVPAPVLAAIKARYPKATVSKAEKLFKDSTTNFELALSGAAVKAVELAPDGTWISPKAAVKK